MTRFKIIRRRFIEALLIAAAAFAPCITLAQTKWPTEKPMTIVVPWPAGSSFDVVARLIADGIQKKYGNTVIVENRTGASGNIGQASVAKAKPDGYTFIVTTPGPAANNVLTFKQLPYDPLDRLHVHRADQPGPERAGRPAKPEREYLQGVHRLRKSQSRQGEDGQPGERLLLAHDAACAPGPCGRRVQHRSVSRSTASAAGPARWPSRRRNGAHRQLHAPGPRG